MPANMQFNRPDGNTAPGYYVEPQAGTAAPGVVVLQEWWGLNDQIERVAAGLAWRRSLDFLGRHLGG